ncbi:hypothetical protein [uncultured Methylophaga sp.]|uniref:hypothetical protein n=1 Tax=uncultured Methylophaga sp. TaxID=285271 RepID=UPI0030F8F80E
MGSFVIKPNMSGWNLFNGYATKLLQANKTITIDVIEGERKKRSLSANALQAVWTQEIADHLGLSEIECRCYLKREFGIPIIKACGDYRAEMIIDFLEKHHYDFLSVEQQDHLIKDLPVTRIMKTKEHKTYMDRLQRFFAEQGLILEVR